MKILVTGGAGFIASHIVDAYIEEGHEVFVIDDLSTGKKENINAKAKFYECDMCTKSAQNIIREIRPDILNHHAAQIDLRKSVKNPLHDIDVNVKALIGLLEVGKDVGLKKVILASTGGAIYGEQVSFPATESHSTNPASPYGINKLMCEKYLYYYEKQYGIPFVALRYSNVYGPRQNAQGEAGVIAIFINKMLKKQQPVIFGDGKQTRDFVYIDDVVKANVLVLGSNFYSSYNVGTGVETSVNNIFDVIKKEIGSSFERQYLDINIYEQKRSLISSGRFIEEVGWAPSVSIVDGIFNTINWFKSNTHK